MDNLKWEKTITLTEETKVEIKASNPVDSERTWFGKAGGGGRAYMNAVVVEEVAEGGTDTPDEPTDEYKDMLIDGDYYVFDVNVADDEAHLIKHEIYDANKNVLGTFVIRYKAGYSSTVVKSELIEDTNTTSLQKYTRISDGKVLIQTSGLNNYISGASTYKIVSDTTLEPMTETLTNVAWNNNTKPGCVSWDAVDGAESYLLTFAYEGDRRTTAITSACTYDYSRNIDASGAYTCTVTAIGGDTLGDSEQVSVTYDYVRPEQEIVPPAKIWWTKGLQSEMPTIMNWNAVDGAMGYRIMLYTKNDSDLYALRLSSTAFGCFKDYLKDFNKYGVGTELMFKIRAYSDNIEELAHTSEENALSFEYVIKNGTVEVNESYFPDEIFRSYVSTNFDTDGDSVLSESELQNVTRINVAKKNVTSLKGIEYFPNLQGLICNSTKITSLDVRYNTELFDLDCSATGITALDVSNNLKLSSLFLQSTDVENLDVSMLEALWYLDISNTMISSIDVSNSMQLEILDIANTYISSLDVSKNTQLVSLYCNGTGLTELDLSANTELLILDYGYTKLTDLDLSDFYDQLTYVGCGGMGLTSFDLSKYPQLTRLVIDGNTELTSLDTSVAPKLNYLNINGTGIENLDLSNNTALSILYCRNTKISELDLSNNTALTSLYCNGSDIRNLDISNNPSLSTLYMSVGTINCFYDFNNVEGFDVEKASNWKNATYQDGKVSDFTAERISCRYALESGKMGSFYFYFDGIKHNYVDGICADCGDCIETDGVVDFVNRMYNIILDREPDADSQMWVDLLKGGSYTGASVAEGFIMSNEFLNKNISNEEFVKIMYRAFFGREADEGGLATWKGSLDEGYMKKFVFAGFANSDEFKALCDTYGIECGVINLTLAEKTPNLSEQDFNIWQFVERLYSEVMGRNPDQTGMDTWVGVLKNGTYTGAQVAEGFILSNEFLNKDMTNEEFVKIMYRAFFNRDADTDGFKTWTEALENGWTKEAVFAGFANSNEFGVLCDMYGITQGSVVIE